MSQDIRQFLTIVEDAEDDVAMHQQAEELRGIIIRHFMDKANAYDHYGLKGARFGGKPEVYSFIEAKDLGFPPEYNDLRLVFASMGGAYGESGKVGRFSSGKVMLELSVTENPLDVEEIARKIVHSRYIHKVMLHELIHYLDSKRNPTIAMSTDSEEAPYHYENGSPDYYNSPQEFNAYFHNISDPLMRMIAFGKENPELAVRYAGMHGITKSFPETVKNLLSGHSLAMKAFLDYLRKRNRRSVMKRLYKMHQIAASYLP